MKKILLITALFLAANSFAQNITIPDSNFKNALLNSDCVDTTGNGYGDSDADTNDDGEIQLSEAEAITGLILYNENIDSLDGIDNFVNLEFLMCLSNNLNSLDLSQNNSLVTLNCGGNQLTTLDISNLTGLETLKCHDNLLTDINVSQNENLGYFNCSSNNLSSLDISQNTNLYLLVCSENPLLTTLDLSNNNSLSYLYCTGNNMTNLDISLNPNIKGLRCEDNKLAYLNIANGNNTDIIQMFAFNNPNLSCINVDDASYNPSCNYDDTFDGWCVDDIASYNESCEVSIKDININEYKIYPNPVKTTLNIVTNLSVNSVNILSVQGDLLKTVNNIKDIDVSELVAGLYLVQIITENSITFKKFIKN